MRSVLCLAIAACAPAIEPIASKPPRGTPEPAQEDAGAPKVTSCPDPSKLDVDELLARHAKAYGTKEQALASFPFSSFGTVERPGLKGKVEITRAKNARRVTSYLDGILRASGYDDKGPWVHGMHGATVRLKPGETRQHPPFIEQRGYLRKYDPQKDVAACDIGEGGRPLVRVNYRMPEEGDPLVVFDLQSAELVASGMREVDGSQVLWQYEKWSEPDKNGVRWPMVQKEISVAPDGSLRAEAELVLDRMEPGLVCPPMWKDGPTAADCVSPYTSRIAWEWDKTKRARAPMRDDIDIVTFTAKAAGKDVSVLFDPMESVLGVVDDDSNAKGAFTSQKHFKLGEGQGSFEFDIGASDISIGGLAVKRAPSLMRKTMSIDTSGAQRPSLVLGAGVSSALAVRVDHAKREIVFAPSGESLAGKTATQLPIRLLGSEAIVVDASINGKKAPMELNFQSALAAEIYESWGNAYDVPGSKPTVQIEKGNVVTRLGKIELGPIKVESRLARVGVRSTQRELAGRLSVAVLLRCQAFVIDPGARTLTLEPPCDRPDLEDLAGWTLARDVSKPTPEPKDRPWMVGALLRDGSADKAGIKEQDRILSVGGKPALLDRAAFLPDLAKPGAKVDVEIMRGTEKKKVTMTLEKLLP